MIGTGRMTRPFASKNRSIVARRFPSLDGAIACTPTAPVLHIVFPGLPKYKGTSSEKMKKKLTERTELINDTAIKSL